MKLFKIMMVTFFLSCFITVLHASSHHPQEFLKKIAGSDQEGKKIVEHYCINCHAEKPLISVGAPRIGQVADWELRIKPGIKHMFKSTDEGLNAMPARGGCFECSDQQLMLAIKAMLPEEFSKKFPNTNVK